MADIGLQMKPMISDVGGTIQGTSFLIGSSKGLALTRSPEDQTRIPLGSRKHAVPARKAALHQEPVPLNILNVIP